jgi:hypothetical protein
LPISEPQWSALYKRLSAKAYRGPQQAFIIADGQAIQPPEASADLLVGDIIWKSYAAWAEELSKQDPKHNFFYYARSLKYLRLQEFALKKGV